MAVSRRVRVLVYWACELKWIGDVDASDELLLHNPRY